MRMLELKGLRQDCMQLFDAWAVSKMSFFHKNLVMEKENVLCGELAISGGSIQQTNDHLDLVNSWEITE